MGLFDIPDSIIALPTKSNEWFTTARYVEAAREVMGGIDLDPASCELANQTIRATHYYSKEDDGLSKVWRGRVWLNPPFGSLRKDKRISSIKAFAYKLLDEYVTGNVTQAVLLVTNQTHASWFVPLWEYPICFTDHHVMFALPNPIPKTAKHSPGRNFDAHMWGTVFVYLGKNGQKFSEIFSEFGPVIPGNVAVRRQPQVIPLELWTA